MEGEPAVADAPVPGEMGRVTAGGEGDASAAASVATLATKGAMAGVAPDVGVTVTRFAVGVGVALPGVGVATEGVGLVSGRGVAAVVAAVETGGDPEEEPGTSSAAFEHPRMRTATMNAR